MKATVSTTPVPVLTTDIMTPLNIPRGTPFQTPSRDALMPYRYASINIDKYKIPNRDFHRRSRVIPRDHVSQSLCAF